MAAAVDSAKLRSARAVLAAVETALVRQRSAAEQVFAGLEQRHSLEQVAELERSLVKVRADMFGEVPVASKGSWCDLQAALEETARAELGATGLRPVV